MSSPLAMILTQNKLTGDNYVDWKRNLDIVLTAENHKQALTKSCPLEPIEESSKEEREEYASWKRSDEVARCYILASMSNVLQQQHVGMESAADIILNLSELFGGQTRQAKQAAIRKLMNLRMKTGTSVRNHMLEVIGLLNEIEIMGGEIDGETQVDMILETLPDSFDSFKLNYSMNKLKYSLSELMKELQAAETLFNKGKNKVGEANLSVKKGSSSKFKKSAKASTSKPAPTPHAEPKEGAKRDQSEDRCHHCNQVGHWRRNCPKYHTVVQKRKRKGCALCNSSMLSD